MSASATCRDIIRSFESESHEIKTFQLLTSLSAATTTEIIANLHAPPGQVSPVKLLRALWITPSLRTQVMLAFAQQAMERSDNIHCNQQTTAVDRQLLDEIGFLVAGDARDDSKPLHQRLHAVSERATILYKQMAAQRSPHHAALLLFCARAAAVIATPAALQVHTRIVSFLLLDAFASTEHLHVHAVTALLNAELALDGKQQTLLLKIVERFVTTSLHEKAVVPLCSSLLTYITTGCSKSTSDRVALTILYLLRDASEDVLADLLVVLEVFVHDHQPMFPHLVRAFSFLVHAVPSQPVRINDHSLRVCPAHIVVLFALLNTTSGDDIQTSLQTILETILTEDVLFDTSQMSSSASTTMDSDYCKRAAFTACVKHPTMETRCEVLLHFFESLMWRAATVRKRAVELLFETFSCIPNSREAVVHVIFNCLVEPDTPSPVISAFATLFEKLVQSKHTAFGLVECKHILTQSVQMLSFIPAAIGVRVVPAFVSIAMLIPSLVDPVLVFLRKISSSRAQSHQRVACAGFVAVLANDHVPEDIVKETCKALSITLNFAPLPVRCALLRLLLSVVTRGGDSVLRVSLLNESVTNRLRQSGTDAEADEQRFIDLTSFFCKEDGELVICDPVPLLLRFCGTVRHDCPNAETIFRRYVAYVGDMNGAIVHACSTDKCSTPVLPRVSLLCSIIQTLCCVSSARSKVMASETYLSDRILWIYGVSIVIRDYLLLRDGVSSAMGFLDGTCWEFGRSASGVRLTAREAAHARKGNERVIEQDVIAEVPMHLWVGALKRVDGIGGNGVLIQTVLSELMDRARRGLERAPHGGWGNDIGACEVDDWQDSLIHIIRSAFVSTCPWVKGDVTDEMSVSSAVKDRPKDDGNVQSGSASTEATVNESQSSDGQRGGQRVDAAMVDKEFILQMELNNSEAAKALATCRFQKLEESARISVRESCLKIVLIMLSKGMIKNEWGFILLLCKECLRLHRAAKESGSVEENAGGVPDTSVPIEQENCVDAIHATAELFRLEFAKSMSVGLTALYLELIYLLLDRINEDGKGGEVMKKYVSSTLMEILRDYSVQHVGLMRQMVKLLLKSFDENEALNFGVCVLQWLGNHVALIDSRYSGIDHVRDSQRIEEGFDDDIVEEALRFEEETEGCNVDIDDDSVVKDVGEDDGADKYGEGDVTEELCSRPYSRENAKRLDPIRSLCLNETAEGAIASICCVLSLFHDVAEKACRDFRSWTRNRAHNDCLDDISNRVDHVVEGMVAFVKGEFVTGCVDGAFLSSRNSQKGGIGSASDLTTKAQTNSRRGRRLRQKLTWPVDLEKKFATLVLNLMDMVDMQLGFLCHPQQPHNKRVGKCCIQMLRMMYEQENTLTLLCCMQEEWSKRWTLEERIENTATLFVKRWQSLKSRQESECSDMNTIADLINRYIFSGNTSTLGSKKRRDVWWRRHTERKDEKVSEDDEIGDERRMLRTNKRQRFRSRNSYVDQYMLENREQESFVDLEAFVVPLHEQQLS